MSDIYGVAEVFKCNRDGTPEFVRTEVECNGEAMSCSDISLVLNEQAETIEVLREWIRENGRGLIADEREIIDNAEFSSPQDLIESKRRIAALEGE